MGELWAGGVEASAPVVQTDPELRCSFIAKRERLGVPACIRRVALPPPYCFLSEVEEVDCELPVEFGSVVTPVESPAPVFGLAPGVGPLPASLVDAAPVVGPLPASAFGWGMHCQRDAQSDP
jgi:hypothetical protein